MVGSTSRVALVLLVAVACGPKGGGDTGPGQPVGDYAALRWVPPDATYALVTRRTDETVQLVRDLLDATAILHGEDAASIGAEIRSELGFDPLALDDLATQGLDPTRGIGLWSRGVGPSIALPLADPPRFAAMLDERRSHGAVVQVARAGKVEVYSWRPEDDVALHWAIVDDWFLAHLEIREERELDGAWYAAATAARGAFAAEADFRAAREATAARLGAAPGLVAVVRVPALFASPLGGGMQPCRHTLGTIGRFFVGASSDGKDARGTIVAELPGGAAGIRAMQLPVPAGWAAARAEAPLAVELGLDLRELGPRWASCLDDEDVTAELVRAGIHGGRAFAHELDVEDTEVRGALAAFGDTSVLTDALDSIPGLSFLRKERTVGGLRVYDVNLPVAPRFSYTLHDGGAVVAAGTSIDPLITGGLVAPGDDLGLVELRPQAWPAAHWDAALAPVIGRNEERARVVRELRRWDLGRVAAALQGEAIVIDLHGRRH